MASTTASASQAGRSDGARGRARAGIAAAAAMDERARPSRGAHARGRLHTHSTSAKQRAPRCEVAETAESSEAPAAAATERCKTTVIEPKVVAAPAPRSCARTHAHRRLSAQDRRDREARVQTLRADQGALQGRPQGGPIPERGGAKTVTGRLLHGRAISGWHDFGWSGALALACARLPSIGSFRTRMLPSKPVKVPLL